MIKNRTKDSKLDKTQTQKKDIILLFLQLSFIEQIQSVIKQEKMLKYKIREAYHSKKYVLPKPTDFEQIRNFYIAEKIGEGGFAAVHRAIHRETKREVAVKIIDSSRFNNKELKRLLEQIEVLRTLNHPNIVKTYQVLVEGTKLYIIMELIKGQQLYQFILNNKTLPQPIAVKVMNQVCKAVRYLHQNKIIHRDIKTENIMITPHFKVKLIDFGLAKNCSYSQSQFLQTYCGSPAYSTPEMLTQKRYNGLKNDIWCIGICLYTAIEGRYPFEWRHGLENAFSLKFKETRFSSEEAISLYKRIFVKEEDRISLTEIMNSTLFMKWSILFTKPKNLEISRSQQLKQNPIKIKITSSQLPRVNLKSESDELSQSKLSSQFCLYNFLAKRSHQKYKNNHLNMRRKTVEQSTEPYQKLNRSQRADYCSCSIQLTKKKNNNIEHHINRKLGISQLEISEFQKNLKNLENIRVKYKRKNSQIFEPKGRKPLKISIVNLKSTLRNRSKQT